MRVKTLWTFFLAGTLTMALSAGAQAPPQQTPSKPPAEQPKEPKKKAKKVWTDEEVKDLRKPWDAHAEEKAAAEEAAKAAQAKGAEAKPGEAAAEEVPIDPATGKPYEDPNSPEAIERRLKGWEEELKRTEQLAVDARREMAGTTDSDRWESAKTKLEIYEANILDIQKKIEEHRGQLAEVKKEQKKPAAKSPAKAATPAPPQ